MSDEWVIDDEHAGWRLDKFLVTRFPAESRSRLQKWVERGVVRVNGRAARKHHFLDHGDRVRVDSAEQTEEPSAAVVQHIPILFEDEAILVVNKPLGVLVHPTPQRPQWTLVDWLLSHAPSSADVGEDPQRPGIVHRLDRDVSGVLLVAKTQAAYQAVKQQFMARTVQKEYRAIVHGVPSQASGVITFTIAHSKTHPGKMAARPTHETGRDAWTEYDVLQTKQNRYALLAVRIRTGRTHQIRAHLAAIDHPVVGDELYASKHYSNHRSYPRLFLHALRLGFTHPTTGAHLEFEAPVPDEFRQFMD